MKMGGTAVKIFEFGIVVVESIDEMRRICTPVTV
jgi:hypothetical protein